MRVLHTSDWHLGQILLDKKRHNEEKNFLNWLLNIIKENKVELLLISGDIFDTVSPSNKARQLYYEFLAELSTTCCKNAVIIGGNHDSPAVLDAAGELLATMNYIVVGGMPKEIENEIININNKLIVCAVPFLRESDIRISSAGETQNEKEANMANAIINHYKKLYEIAHSKYPNTPIIATGHLFSSGGKVIEDDGVRDLYVGNLGHVNMSSLSNLFAYIALGHLHIKQKVGGLDNIRYCGSPRYVGFGECNQSKIVLLLDIGTDKKFDIEEIAVPIFQKMKKIKGDLSLIKKKLNDFISEDESIWVSIEYDGDNLVPDLPEILGDIIENTKVEILKISNKKAFQNLLPNQGEYISLDELSEIDVFEKVLDENNIEDKDKEILKELFMQIYNEVKA